MGLSDAASVTRPDGESIPPSSWVSMRSVCGRRAAGVILLPNGRGGGGGGGPWSIGGRCSVDLADAPTPQAKASAARPFRVSNPETRGRMLGPRGWRHGGVHMSRTIHGSAGVVRLQGSIHAAELNQHRASGVVPRLFGSPRYTVVAVLSPRIIMHASLRTGGNDMSRRRPI